ncbi:MAG TPA: ATP-dependent 6-phosphofructokinase [Myxococcales bacterium]|nr:ATP-dependent 6-phosphofructokinase [Myxococcales bacterium]
MKIAVLTGGGDCPGLNAVIRAVVRRGEQQGLEIMGVREGWRGLMDPPLHDRLTREATSGILHLGGTILGTSRTNPFKKPGGAEMVLRNLAALNVGGVVAIGGEDTLGVATRLHQMGANVLGVPKTIDNDLAGTDLTFGFDTAVQIATDAIDRLHSTAESHNRVIVCEVMGRHAGWIAVHSGIAGGADVILIPEKPVDIDRVCEQIGRRHRSRGVNFSIVVVAEGAKLGGQEARAASRVDEFGHVRLGGIGQQIAELIEKATGFETRATVLGHIQRGGTPTAFDRVLATRFGVHAADMVARKEWGKMAALRGNQIVSVPLAEATAKLKTVDDAFYGVAEVFFG